MNSNEFEKNQVQRTYQNRYKIDFNQIIRNIQAINYLYVGLGEDSCCNVCVIGIAPLQRQLDLVGLSVRQLVHVHIDNTKSFETVFSRLTLSSERRTAFSL